MFNSSKFAKIFSIRAQLPYYDLPEIGCLHTRYPVAFILRSNKGKVGSGG